MNVRRAILSLCMICALASSAFLVAGAAAATKGTTAFTCKKMAVEGGAGFSREHCKVEDAVGTSAKYEHLAIAESAKTEVTVSNETTNGEKRPRY
jgi:hypothetical protein